MRYLAAAETCVRSALVSGLDYDVASHLKLLI